LVKKKINAEYEDEETSCEDYYQGGLYRFDLMDKTLIGSIILLGIVAVIIIANITGLINLKIIGAQMLPPRTMYLTPNAFPITAYGSMNGVNMTYVFYGAMQSNGTECIDGVAVYPFNYTSQSYSSTPETTTYNPEEVAKIYYSNGIYSTFNLSNGKPFVQYDGDTLLCPSVINAIK